jgi:hypothetical protein
MYDVNKKQKNLKEIIPMLEEVIEKDEMDSALVMIRKKNGDVVSFKVQGEASDFEMVGILECIKDKFKGN